jgi:hypothetical protein
MVGIFGELLLKPLLFFVVSGLTFFPIEPKSSFAPGEKGLVEET